MCNLNNKVEIYLAVKNENVFLVPCETGRNYWPKLRKKHDIMNLIHKISQQTFVYSDIMPFPTGSPPRQMFSAEREPWWFI